MFVFNPDQADTDEGEPDKVGDACGMYETVCILCILTLMSLFTDNCVLVFNGDQIDSDGDGLGDACDPVSVTLHYFVK